MSLLAIGLSHHNSPLAVREKLHFDEKSLPSALQKLKVRLEGAGVVILSTCNRVEVYAHGDMDAEAMAGHIVSFLGEWHSVPADALRDALYIHEDREAVGHVFRVASSLDSLVVGEGQILGQVHDAFLLAQAEQTTDRLLHSLFQKAFSVAKRVRTETSISEGKVSVGSVAVDLAVSIFMELTGKCVMVIGSGKMGELALKSLIAKGADHVLLVNRSLDKAEELARKIRGESVALADIAAHLHRADIVISSTASQSYILGASDFQKALRSRSHAPMFVIDIAVPRDIEPAVKALDNVYLYDVDDLKKVTDSNLEARRQEMTRCLAMVEDGAEKFVQWWRGLAAEPTIVSMSEELNAIREMELQRTLSAIPELTDEQRAEIEYLTKRIVNKILQKPMKQLKQEVIHEDPNRVLHLVKRLFGLKEGV
ncbi:MAG: glutamyl-tRNA reductase [Candidatus Hydrogenedentota bacterium]